jgi:hypothetical protein
VPKSRSVLTHTKISQIPFYTLVRSIFAAPAFQLEDNRPIPFKIIEGSGIKHLDIRKIASYTKSRYLDWIWAGGLSN